MLDIFKDALIDTLKLIPFLFISFIIMELIEHKLTSKKKLTKLNKFGPLAGATLGIIPQCGFGALASNLYAARVISLGTLISIYLSTSDEMVPIMLSEQASISKIIPILLYKFLLGLFFGILIDVIYHKKISNEIHQLCEEEHCHCKDDGILKSSIIHTLKIAFFIFVVNLVLNSIIDPKIITNFVTNNKILSPIIMSFIGLIPNCAASVIITKLYLDNIITFGSLLSGLLSSSGVGLLILFKQNKNFKENFIILFLLIIIASICGIVLNFI